MVIFENIFYLSILYIVFNLIWSLIVQLPKIIITSGKNSSIINHAITSARYLLLSSLTYSTCYNYVFKNSLSDEMVVLIYLTGGIVLSLYLAGKLNKKQTFLRFASSVSTNLKFGKNNFIRNELIYEKHIVGISIVIFASCVGIPIFGEIMSKNLVNVWFLKTIDGIYNAPILKWFIGFAGIIFMFSMFQKAIFTIKRVISKFNGENNTEDSQNPLNDIMNEFEKMNNPNSKNPFNEKGNKVDIEDDIFVDFEELKEDDEKK